MSLSETLHPPAGDDDAADAVVHHIRHFRLPAIAGLGAAARRFSDHPGLRPIARRQRRYDGVLGRGSARALLRDDPRHHDDDLVVEPRAHQYRHAVRPRSQYRRRRAGRAVEYFSDFAQVAAAIARSAEFSEGQPRRQPDSVHRARYQRRCLWRRSTIMPNWYSRSRFRRSPASRKCRCLASRNSPCASTSIPTRPRRAA